MPRELAPRELVPRELLLRELVPLAPREDLAAPEARVPVDFVAPEERVEPEFEDFERVDVDLLPDAEVDPLLRDDVPVERAPLLREVVPVERLPELRDAVLVERELPLRDAEPLERELPLRPDEDEPLLADPSKFHLPDITRCAASATASAMIEPNFVALDTMLLAACDAVSAASRPASRIFLRAAGLAAIAAAAAVSPAASISLLIAAFAILSIVSLDFALDDVSEPAPEPLDPADPEREAVEREELLRADLAISCLPPSRQRHFNAVPVP